MNQSRILCLSDVGSDKFRSLAFIHGISHIFNFSESVLNQLKDLSPFSILDNFVKDIDTSFNGFNAVSNTLKLFCLLKELLALDIHGVDVDVLFVCQSEGAECEQAHEKNRLHFSFLYNI